MILSKKRITEVLIILLKRADWSAPVFPFSRVEAQLYYGKYCKMMVLMDAVIRIANREDPDQTAFSFFVE